MANQLSKTGIGTTETIEAWHVTQSIDAFKATEAYDLFTSGSIGHTGQFSVTGTNTELGKLGNFESSYSSTNYIRIKRTGEEHLDLGASSAAYGGWIGSSGKLNFSVNGDSITSPAATIATNGTFTVNGFIVGDTAAIGTSTITSVGRTTTFQNVGGYISSQGFDSRTTHTVTVPNAPNWYRILKWGGISRGGGVIKLSTVGGDFAPATWVIKCFKTYGADPSKHTLKLEQYGNTDYITDARIVTDSSDDITYLEIYSPQISIGGIPTDLLLSVYDDKLLGYNDYTEVFTGTLNTTTGTSAIKLELPFIEDGTSVESLHVSSSVITSGMVSFTNLPTSDPGVPGRLYRSGDDVKIST